MGERAPGGGTRRPRRPVRRERVRATHVGGPAALSAPIRDALVEALIGAVRDDLEAPGITTDRAARVAPAPGTRSKHHQ